jgi:hypothetical protein
MPEPTCNDCRTEIGNEAQPLNRCPQCEKTLCGLCLGQCLSAHRSALTDVAEAVWRLVALHAQAKNAEQLTALQGVLGLLAQLQARVSA